MTVVHDKVALLPAPASVRDPVLRRFVSDPLFGQPDNIGTGTAFRRPLRPQDIDQMLAMPLLGAKQLTTNASLMAHRVLTTIYEQDLVFLPGKDDAGAFEDFAAFYAQELRDAGLMCRSGLERMTFNWLDEEVRPVGKWTVEAMREFLTGRLAEENATQSKVCAAILNANDPAAAARRFLVQLSGDFLTEASAMARNTLGNYGPGQSGLFTILIDEYGYGVHASKHSTRFEDTLRSVGLSDRVHHYWPWYLPTSFALINYFHYVSAHHTRFFRYIGALLYTEGTLHEANRQQSIMLKKALGPDVDTLYFDEHAQIDILHSDMALERVIMPVIERCGTSVIPEIVRGFEEFAVLQALADDDLIAHIRWTDNLETMRVQGQVVEMAMQNPETLTFTETAGEVSVPHVHDIDELFLVDSGSLTFHACHDCSIEMKAGDAILIPSGRLHGTVITSDTCTYRVAPMGEAD